VLSAPDEPGERLVFRGRILDAAGKPVGGASVLAYHADQEGLYNPPNTGTRVPRLRGTATTDTTGRYAFSTVRPGAYPGADEPAHIHLEITVPGGKVRYVTYWFDDDPKVTPAQRTRASRDPEIVIVHAALGASGVWEFTDDVRLAPR
jgi:protocatechuate 3,4-dioxygenase beta subunit